jgi:transposase
MRGPKPVYQPKFTEEQVECAKRLARRHKTPQAKAKRAQLALLLNERPDIDCVSLAKKLGMHEQWVRKWRRRWVREGFSLDDKPRSGRPPRFSPLDKVSVKAVACELPAKKGEPVSVYHISDIKRILDDEGQVLPMRKSTICRILKEDALRPWRHHPWVYPRDPEFREKAEIILDLYQECWRGRPSTKMIM